VKVSDKSAHVACRTSFCFPGYVLLLALSMTPNLAAQNGVSGEPGTISVDVNLVVLQLSVRDARGDFVPGLQRGDFQVWEDGKPQAIRVFQHEDVPVSLGLIVDSSSSMNAKRKDVTAAALAFVRSSNPQDEMFVVNFNERVRMGLPNGKLFSTSAPELESALNDMPASGMTALYDAIDRGLTNLTKATRDKKVLIVVSDGGDNASHHKLRQVLDAAGHSNVVIYTIGLFDEHDGDQNPGVLRQLARATGGEAFFPSESGEVLPICERIAADIRHQYTIAYESTNQKLDNTWRTIRVKARGPHGEKLTVRTREGYFASPRSQNRAESAQ
jgi:Ca-activated chloride channel homolog